MGWSFRLRSTFTNWLGSAAPIGGTCFCPISLRRLRQTEWDVQKQKHVPPFLESPPRYFFLPSPGR